ncbi:hypothetical protein [Bifidobacterium pseudolongum]|uniref:hypothetical protein n=1 Tax=Bifidobacterium pseudolongum TaxID=1694 RepID=UPI0022DF7D3C|nr:hypothetical protein [Bifidobacterium pseudolongum]
MQVAVVEHLRAHVDGVVGDLRAAAAPPCQAKPMISTTAAVIAVTTAAAITARAVR